MATFRPLPPEAALITVTMIWGLTFLAVEAAMGHSGPLFFVALRYAVATAALGAVSLRRLRGVTARELVAGGLIGVTICAGYALQTAGVAEIGASRSAFITALYVPLVPLLQAVLLRRPPGRAAWAGVGLALAGLVLVAGPGAQGGLGRGEILTLLSAVAIAGEILLIGAFAGRVDARRVTLVQMAVACVLAALVMPVAGEGVPVLSPVLLALAGALGLASAGIQLVMNWAQRSVSPTRATVIYATEPVWAGVFGRIAGERLPGLAVLGGALIVAGVIVSAREPASSPAGH